MDQPKRLTKKERRQLRQSGIIIDTGLNSISPIKPKTITQNKIIETWNTTKNNILMHGTAGTGKTFVGLFLAFDLLFKSDVYERIIIFRSAVPSRDIGFLPGSAHEKMKVYEDPYSSICSELFGRYDAYEVLKQQRKIEFVSTSYIRGTTFNNAILIIDEFQNMNWAEISTILTRVGNYSRVILCGDTKQSDLTDKTGKADVMKLLNVCKNMGSFSFFQMGVKDIVRSGFVKEFILQCENLGY